MAQIGFSLAIYLAAALAEIAGCFAFWMWLRRAASIVWLVPALLALSAFAFLLTRIESDTAGRAYASYGGVYIAASIAWIWLIEGQRPDRWDVAGGAICLVGAGIILFARRS